MTQGPERSRLRLVILGMIFVSAFSALGLRLYYLQILTRTAYAAAAEDNQVRLVPSEPARGRVLDRNGQVLVRNRQSNTVSIRTDELVDRKATLSRLASLLGTTTEEVEARLADRRALPFAAIPVAEDVPEDKVVYIMEHRDQFAGVITEIRPARVYPNGKLASHLLGYTGEISQEQLSSKQFKSYRLGSIVGRSGIEASFERDLRGRDGIVKLQVNAAGKVQGEPLGFREPQPGFDLVTTIDARIQALAEESLALGIARARTIFDEESQKHYLAPAGGAVVMDPRNGEILAMASYPDYDPSLFIGGIPAPQFAALTSDPAKPLLNRVIQAEFPPGSTFKAVTAAAALQDGLATRTGRYPCPAFYRFSDVTFRNWRAADSGSLTMVQALEASCDTVFYPFGAEFWRRFRRDQGERLQDYARSFGFGSLTGLDLPFEHDGVVPDNSWLQEMHARFPEAFPYKIWLPGYTINMTIGQGDLVGTPLQLAVSYAAIANGGRVVKPHVGLKVVDGENLVRTMESETVRVVPVSGPNLDTIRQGLELVPISGTARSPFAGWPHDQVRVAAKTGTAQLQTIPPKQPYAWFVVYAPARDPKYLVVTMVEEGGHGSETAAPISRRILEGLLGLPLSDVAPAAKVD